MNLKSLQRKDMLESDFINVELKTIVWKPNSCSFPDYLSEPSLP